MDNLFVISCKYLNSCPQGSLSYRALTASMLTRQFSAPDKYVQTYWVFTSVSSWVPTRRLPLYGHNFECLPYMDIWSPVPGYQNCNSAAILYLRLRDTWHALIRHSFSLINRRIYEIILRQGGEILWLPDIILYNWIWRTIIIDNRTRRRNL